MVIGQENGSLVLELLRDDCDPFLTEYFLHSDHRIQCSESCIVQIDSVSRHAFVDQGVLHVGWFIVALDVVVAAHNEIVDLPVVVELHCRNDSVFEIAIRPAY